MLALQAWDRFEPGTNLKSWLFQILHNHSTDIARMGSATAQDPAPPPLSRQSERMEEGGSRVRGTTKPRSTGRSGLF
jgi:DNA-directed RNA polymerase specialized sigma24 family protein